MKPVFKMKGKHLSFFFSIQWTGGGHFLFNLSVTNGCWLLNIYLVSVRLINIFKLLK